MTGEVNWTIIAVVNPGKEERLEGLAHRSVSWTKGNELGVLEYAWNHSAENGAWSIHIKTSSRESALAFLRNFETRFLQHLLDYAAIQHTLVFGNPPDAVRKRLEVLKPVYMAEAAGFERKSAGGPSLMQ
jgi:hypothetical protein